MKKVIALILVVVGIISMTACGANNQNQNAQTTTATPAVTGTTSETTVKKGIDMTFWIFLNPASTEDPRNVVLKEIIDDYNATNKYGNKVTVESIHWSKFESQAIQAAAAGTGPDIMNCFTDMLRTHIEGGTIQPMTKYAEAFITATPDYIHKAENLKVNGEIYALPWESRATVMWYRNDIYPTAPKSIDEIVSMGSAATKNLALGYVVGLGEGSNATGLMETFIPLIRSAGGELLDENGKAVFNSDAGVKVVNFLKSLVDSKTMDQTTMSMTYDDVVAGFMGGTILAMNAGTQRAAKIKSSDLAAKFSSAPIPGFDGKSAPAFVAGQQLAIGKYAKDTDLSFDFIENFYSVENQKKWISANVLPVRSAVYDDPEIKKLPAYNEMVMWSEYAKTGKVVFFPADYSELSSTLAQAVQTVVFKGADAKAKLDEVANWYNQKNGK